MGYSSEGTPPLSSAQSKRCGIQKLLNPICMQASDFRAAFASSPYSFSWGEAISPLPSHVRQSVLCGLTNLCVFSFLVFSILSPKLPIVGPSHILPIFR